MNPPREYKGWTLIEHNKGVSLHEQIGTVKIETGDTWSLRRSVTNLRMYLFTTLPHPDNPDTHCIYVRDYASDFRSICDHLTKNCG